jgi:hypothetical protein
MNIRQAIEKLENAVLTKPVPEDLYNLGHQAGYAAALADMRIMFERTVNKID